jgi:hypothetical protein
MLLSLFFRLLAASFIMTVAMWGPWSFLLFLSILTGWHNALFIWMARYAALFGVTLLAASQFDGLARRAVIIVGGTVPLVMLTWGFPWRFIAMRPLEHWAYLCGTVQLLVGYALGGAIIFRAAVRDRPTAMEIERTA